MFCQGFYFEFRARGKIRIFGFHNNTNTKKRVEIFGFHNNTNTKKREREPRDKCDS